MNNEKEFLKYVSRPIFITNEIFDKGFGAIDEIGAVLTLNKPFYVRFAVLELSKWLMYDFHYNFIGKRFDTDLLLTDTGSLCHDFVCDGVYEEFCKWKELFDFSNYSKSSKLFSEENEKVIEKMKDEFGGRFVKEFVGLKSKLYSMKLVDDCESSRAKGVNTKLDFNEFKDVLFNKKIVKYKTRGIKAKKHRIGTYKINRKSLSCFDDKRFVDDDGIHTRAYFHKK